MVVNDKEEWWTGGSTTQSGFKLSTNSHKRAHPDNAAVGYLNTCHALAAAGPDGTELASRRAVNSCWPNQL